MTRSPGAGQRLILRAAHDALLTVAKGLAPEICCL